MIWSCAQSAVDATIEILAIVLCVTLPFAFFPFSRTLWLAWDLSFRPSEPGDGGGNADVNAPYHPRE